jgi:hypothetical protein
VRKDGLREGNREASKEEEAVAVVIVSSFRRRRSFHCRTEPTAVA